MSGYCIEPPVPDALLAGGTGNLIQALAEAAEALRHSGAAMHSSDAPVDQAPGEPTPNDISFAVGLVVLLPEKP